MIPRRTLHEELHETIKNLALDLPEFRVVGTVGETHVANKVYDSLSRLRYFRSNNWRIKLWMLKAIPPCANM